MIRALQDLSDFRAHLSPLFKKWKIIKMKDIVDMQNCLLNHSFLNNRLPKSFENFFKSLVISTQPPQDL